MNDAGLVVESVWSDLPVRFPNVVMGAFIIMPNHFHGILMISNDVGALLAAPHIESGNENQGAASSAPTECENMGGSTKYGNTSTASGAPTKIENVGTPTLGKIIRLSNRCPVSR